jgi:hypothetical protein
MSTIQTQIELLKKALEEGNTGFLVKYDGKFHWAIICLDSLKQRRLAFFISGHFMPVELHFGSIVLPGEPGKQRNILIKCSKTNSELVARFVGFYNETFCQETNNVCITFKVSIRSNDSDVRIVKLEDIVPRFPTEIELRAHDELMAEKLQAAADEQREFELRMQIAKEQSICPMALPRHKDNPVVYPIFNQIDLRVLFLLCAILKVPFKPSYYFNRLVVRFLACGSQERFQEDIPPLSSQNELAFQQFFENYNKFFMGTAMTSRTLRCSNLTVQQVFLAQFEIAKAMKVQAQCALKIPREYFTSAEPGVDLLKGEHDLIAHSFLEKLE